MFGQEIIGCKLSCQVTLCGNGFAGNPVYSGCGSGECKGFVQAGPEEEFLVADQFIPSPEKKGPGLPIQRKLEFGFKAEFPFPDGQVKSDGRFSQGESGDQGYSVVG